MLKYLKVIVVLLIIGGAYYYFSAPAGNSDNGPAKHADHDNSGNGGSHGSSAGAKNAVVPVAVASAKTGDIPVYLQELGNIVPRSAVTVHTQITGELMEVLFNEGQMVQKDDLLARIDDRPYIAALEQAEGILTRDQALLSEAKVDLERYKTLWTQNSIAKQQLDTQASLVKQYEGAVLNDEGQIDAAKTNLIYTKITAPVAGRVGLRQVDPGNIVHTTDSNGIVIVTELQPITAIFTVPEDNLPAVMKHYNAGEQLIAEAWDRDNKNKIASGTLTAIDNQIDSTTGTVKFRAEFSNEDNALFPNQFVNIRLKLDTLKDVVTIPVAAVQRGTHGTFVYLVKPDQTVSVQNITLGPESGEVVSVQQGIAVGNQVVVDGADALRDGARIEIPDANAPAEGKAKDKGDKAEDKGDKAGGDKSKDKSNQSKKPNDKDSQ